MTEDSTTSVLHKIESFVTQMVSDLRRVDPSYNPCGESAPTAAPAPAPPVEVKPRSFDKREK